jgi:ADP-heptose:LPS heptosyltransferase
LAARPGTCRPSDYVVVHPGAASQSRRWPQQRWIEVVRWLRAHGHEVLVTGGASERDLCAAIADACDGVRSVAGALDLAALADLVAGADLLICGDTGVAHLGTAYATASVLLFGPVSPQHWGPAIDPARHTVLWHGTRTGVGDPHGSRVDPALALITVEEVIRAAGHLTNRLAVAND